MKNVNEITLENLLAKCREIVKKGIFSGQMAALYCLQSQATCSEWSLEEEKLEDNR